MLPSCETEVPFGRNGRILLRSGRESGSGSGSGGSSSDMVVVVVAVVVVVVAAAAAVVTSSGSSSSSSSRCEVHMYSHPIWGGGFSGRGGWVVWRGEPLSAM